MTEVILSLATATMESTSTLHGAIGLKILRYCRQHRKPSFLKTGEKKKIKYE